MAFGPVLAVVHIFRVAAVLVINGRADGIFLTDGGLADAVLISFPRAARQKGGGSHQDKQRFTHNILSYFRGRGIVMILAVF